MNRKQMMVLWIGITVFVLMGLFPPFIFPRSYYVGTCYKFILFLKYNIDIIRLCVQWAMLSVITGGLIYTLKGKTEQTIMNRNQEIVLWIGIIIFALMCLFPPYRQKAQPRYYLGTANYVTVYRFFLNDFYHPIQWTILLIQCGIVTIITGGLIYALKDKNKPRQVGEKPESTE